MDVKELIKEKKGTLIDVREPMELMLDGKIDDAINIPLGEIEERIEEIQLFEKPLILFCRSGNRSGKAIELLSSKGFDHLYNGMGYADVKAILD